MVPDVWKQQQNSMLMSIRIDVEASESNTVHEWDFDEIICFFLFYLILANDRIDIKNNSNKNNNRNITQNTNIVAMPKVLKTQQPTSCKR